MDRSLNKYRQDIQSGKINPVVRWDGKTSGKIFDAADAETPLEFLACGAWRLEQGPFDLKTENREYVLVPTDGDFEVAVGGEVFAGSRTGGVFAAQPEVSNATAIFIGSNQQAKISGRGEMVWFSAPSFGDKPPVFIKPGEKKQFRRGTSTWHREVVMMVSPAEGISTNIVLGETYSPPGLWSVTPLHVHDKDNVDAGQSDHEEIYYHLARVPEGDWGAYGVQLMFDDKGLDKAFMVHNRDMVAIPGGAHPVVVGPNSDMIYLWALASEKPSKLTMLDVPEFAYLKSIEAILDTLRAKHPRPVVTTQELADLADQYQLKGVQREMLRQHLIERDFEIQ